MLITPQIKIGTVTNFSGAVGTGLLQTLVDWVTSDPLTPGLDWTVERNSVSMDDDGLVESFPLFNHREYILSNVGVSGNENIFIGMRESSVPASNIYQWNLNGYLMAPASGWNTHRLGTHNLTLATLPCLQLFDNQIAYWFYSTQEFIIVAVRISTSWFQCYLGNGIRMVPPDSYPYPLVIAGSRVSGVSYQTSGNAGPVRPINATSGASYFIIAPDSTFLKWNTNVIAVPMQAESDTSSIRTTMDGAAMIAPSFFVTLQNVLCMQLFNMGVWRKTSSMAEQEYVDSDKNLWRVFVQGATDNDYDFLAIFERENYTTTTSTTSTSTTSTSTTSTSTTSTSTTSTTTTTV